MKTIKIFGIACVLLTICSSLPGQILQIQGRNVPPGNMGKVIERETTYWAEVARKAIKDGHMTGWRMYRLVDSMHLDEEPNIIFVNEFTPEQMRSEVNIWDFKQVFPDKELEDVETFSLGTLKSQAFFYNIVNIGTAEPKYIRVNFAKAEDGKLARYLELEQSVWQPFIQERMDSGQTNVVSWALSVAIYPRGRDLEWDAITVDGFATFADALNSIYGENAVMPENEEIWDVHHKAVVHLYELIMAIGPEK